jgi:proline iminopeptidase
MSQRVEDKGGRRSIEAKPWRSGLLLSLLLAGCLDPNEPGNLVAKTVDEDPTIPRIELNGSVFHAETFGDPAAPVIIVLHGGPGGDYRAMLRMRNPVDGVRLEDRHLVVFWDQRGSGLSRRHDQDDVTQEAYDEDLRAVVDKFSPGRPVVLLGHSWGGMYASRFISLHPDRVAGAVLMEPGPLSSALYEEVKDGIHHMDLWSEWLNDYAWSSAILSPEDHARLDYFRMLGNFGNSQPAYHVSTVDREPCWRLGAVANQAIEGGGVKDGWDFTKGLERFQPKVLFEASERNEVIGAEFQRHQMKAYPTAALEIVAGAGHDFQWTQPEATLRPVVAYLAEIGF